MKQGKQILTLSPLLTVFASSFRPILESQTAKAVEITCSFLSVVALLSFDSRSISVCVCVGVRLSSQGEQRVPATHMTLLSGAGNEEFIPTQHSSDDAPFDGEKRGERESTERSEMRGRGSISRRRRRVQAGCLTVTTTTTTTTMTRSREGRWRRRCACKRSFDQGIASRDAKHDEKVSRNGW